MRFNRRISLIASATLCAAVTHASDFILEEVVVTAQKREQSMQDVGIAINAFSGETIEAMGMTSTNELSAITPNLSITNPVGEGGTPAVVMRGVGLSDFSVTNQPPIGFYVDEVAVGNANAQVGTMLDVERVEVLKGPQGTLYGRNTTGGAINIISRKPTEELEGYAKLSYGRYNTRKVEGAVSGSITDTLQGRLALVDYHSDGWQENTNFGTDVEKNNFSARVMLAWQPTNDINVLVNLHGARNDSDADLYNSTLDSDFYKNGSEFEPQLNIDSQGASVKVEWDISDDLVLTSITAYDDLDKLHQEDADMMPIDVLVTQYGVDTHTFSQELRLNGVSGDYTWIAGVFYGRDVINGETYLNLIRKAGEWGYELHQEVETTAAFGQLEFDLAEDLRLTLGLRATRDSVEFEDRAGFSNQGFFPFAIGMDSLSDGSFTYFSDFNGAFGPINTNVDASGLYKDDISNTEISGNVGLDWSVSEDVMLYGSLSRGYKSGAFPGNFIFNPVALEPYDKEVLTAYELGIKSDLLDNSLRLNAALFYYAYTDAQVYNTSDDLVVQMPANRVVNVDVDVWGLDADISWQPTESLFVQFSAGVTKSEYGEDLNDVITGPVPLEGKQLQNAPELSASLLANYEWIVGEGSAFEGSVNLQLDASWQDDIYFSTEEDVVAGQEAYGLLNSRLSWRNTDDTLEVAIWGKNLADKEYATYAYDLRGLFGIVEYMRGTPRLYGIDVKYTF